MLSTASFPTAQSSATQFVQQLKLLKSLKFLKHKFGKKGEERELSNVCVLLLIHKIFLLYYCMIIIITLRFNLRATNFKFWGMPPDRLESKFLENHGS